MIFNSSDIAHYGPFKRNKHEKFTLTYFDMHGGRGEPARLAMSIGGIEFEDIRFPHSDFPTVRTTTPLGQVPTFSVDGQVFTQGNAISRYVGKLTGLYPTDAYEALKCDEMMDAHDDVSNKIVTTFGLEGEALKAARETLIADTLNKYLLWTAEKLTAAGGEYFSDGKLTIADLKVFVTVRAFNSGMLDHIPTNLVEQLTPSLQAHAQRVAAHPAIAAYYQSFAG